MLMPSWKLDPTFGWYVCSKSDPTIIICFVIASVFAIIARASHNFFLR